MTAPVTPDPANDPTPGKPGHAAPTASLWDRFLAVVGPRIKALAGLVVAAVSAAVLPVLFASDGSSVAFADPGTIWRTAVGAAIGAIGVYLAPANQPPPG